MARPPELQLMKTPLKMALALFLACLLLAGNLGRPSTARAEPAEPVVQAVLFYRSSCSHCVQLVVEVMPPILQKYGRQLQVFYCDVSTPQGDALFTSAIDRFKIETIGTPTLIIGSDVLIGSVNIADKFPGLIEAGLAGGGLGWPDLPGLAQAFDTAGSMEMPLFAYPGSVMSNVPTPVDTGPVPGTTGSAPAPSLRGFELMQTKFLQDPRGNTLSVVVLVALLAALAAGIVGFLKRPGHPLAGRPSWLIPLACAAGIGISAYLAHVEINQVEALCGPVGECDVVQQSPYARLFGVLPIGVLGVAGYIAMIIAWAVARFARPGWADLAGLALLGMALFGVLFSLYLTFLEPFVIGATCLWCLSSAVLMAALLLLCLPSGKLAYHRLAPKILLRSRS
jgi:uncharacterized membrane protein